MSRSRSNSAVDALVSLDTTQDYYPTADPRWGEMCTTVAKGRENMTGPLLMVANPHAFFQLADSLTSARRYYLTIKDLDHNDFIAQGVISRRLRHKLGPVGEGRGPIRPRTPKPRPGRRSPPNSKRWRRGMPPSASIC